MAAAAGASLERAELYLCLARSFLLPQGDVDGFAALREALPEDLEALCGALSWGAAARPIDDYRRTVAAMRGPDDLALTYSQLFTAPPRLAHLNSSAYLDGMVMGASVNAIEQCYLRCGVERSDSFRNLSDHVSVQLEFVAFLYASGERSVAPEHFLDSFVRRWLPPFLTDLEMASLKIRTNPYLALAQILQVAVEEDAVPMPKDARLERKKNALVRARRIRATEGVTAEDLQEIERRMKAKGLSTDHLALR